MGIAKNSERQSLLVPSPSKMHPSFTLLPTAPCSTCTLCSRFCSNIASSPGTTATSSSGSNCGTQHCSRTGTYRVRAVRQKVVRLTAAAAAKGTLCGNSCSSRASSRHSIPSPTDVDPNLYSPHCNRRGKATWLALAAGSDTQHRSARNTSPSGQMTTVPDCGNHMAQRSWQVPSLEEMS